MSDSAFEVHQTWEGVVLEVHDVVFAARLVSENLPDQYAEIYLDAVEPSERTLVRPGAIFDWRIGERGGQDHSTLHFRHETRKVDMARVEQLAREWKELFEDDSQ